MFKKLVLVALAATTLGFAPLAGRASAATGHWTPNSPSITQRANATYAVLSDGRVVVPGGVGNSGALDAAEVYDPSTDRWAALPAMHQARWFPRAAALPGDKVLVVGLGDSQFVGHGTYEIYDAGSNAWSTPETFATEDYDGRLFAYGSTVLYLDRVDSASYDAATDAWTPLSVPWTTDRGFSYAVELADGRILAVVGTGANAVAFLYDAESGQWSPTSTPPDALNGFSQAVQLHDGRVLVVSSVFQGGAKPFVSAAAFFDPTTQSWASTSLPDGDLHASRLAVTAGGSALLVGGDTWTWDGNGGYYGSYEKRSLRLDPSSNTWSAEPDMQTGRVLPLAAQVASGLLVFAGDIPGNEAPSSQVYVDNAPPPVASVADASISEGKSGYKKLYFAVTLDRPAPTSITVRLDAASGTATARSDFAAGPAFGTIKAGATSGTVGVVIAGDQVVEPDETFTVSLSGFGITLGRSGATGTIINDDIGGCVTPRPNTTKCVGVQDPLTSLPATPAP